MQLQQKIIFVILVSIIIVGIVGIPIGNPKFFTNAVVLESIFIILAILTLLRLRYALAPNIIIATVVIIGNTVSPKHIEIMSTITPLENAVVLIVGGYLLQSLLLITSTIMFKNRMQLQLKTK